MKARYLALLIIGALPLMAFDCLVDQSSPDFNVTLRPAPFNHAYAINPGTNTAYGGSVTFPSSLLFADSAYEITSVSVFDITVSTSGPNLGNCSGNVTANGLPLFSYSGTWTAFNTPQSLLTSPLITSRNPAGVTALINAINRRQNIALAVSGNITTTPVPTGCSVGLTAYFQTSGHFK